MVTESNHKVNINVLTLQQVHYMVVPGCERNGVAMVTFPVGVQIKKFREELGVSQAAFAEILHVARTTVTHWESGKREMDASALGAASIALGVDPVVLLGIQDHVSSITAHDRVVQLLCAEGIELAAAVIAVPVESVNAVTQRKLRIPSSFFRGIAEAYDISYAWLMTGRRNKWYPSLKGNLAARLRFLRICTGIPKTEALEPYWHAIERSDDFFRSELAKADSDLNAYMAPMIRTLIALDEKSRRALSDDPDMPQMNGWDWVVAEDLD
jgi:transcriptional regulator with XRE-family HTH domain